MSLLIFSIHTRTGGVPAGWWGAVIHPAHLSERGRLLKSTAWTRKVQQALTLTDCYRRLLDLAGAIPPADYGHENTPITLESPVGGGFKQGG